MSTKELSFKEIYMLGWIHGLSFRRKDESYEGIESYEAGFNRGVQHLIDARREAATLEKQSHGNTTISAAQAVAAFKRINGGKE